MLPTDFLFILSSELALPGKDLSYEYFGGKYGLYLDSGYDF